MKPILAVVFSMVFLGWLGGRIVADINYTQECGGHLKRAADANTVELASSELAVAIRYLEANHMTDGYTSVLYRTPDEDVGFWYSNLKAAQKELIAVAPDATQLERTNVLMKLRETLLDNGESGTTVTHPDGISVFPDNNFWAFWGWLSFLGVLGVMFVGVVENW